MLPADYERCSKKKNGQHEEEDLYEFDDVDCESLRTDDPAPPSFIPLAKAPAIFVTENAAQICYRCPGLLEYVQLDHTWETYIYQ